MPRSGDESGGGSTRVLSLARRRLPARRVPLMGAAATRRRFAQGRLPIALPRFARLRSRRRFGAMQRTARVAMSQQQCRRCHARAVREQGYVVPGRRRGVASEPLLPRQNSFFVGPPDRQVLVSKASRPGRAIGGADPWFRSPLHRLIPTPIEVPS